MPTRAEGAHARTEEQRGPEGGERAGVRTSDVTACPDSLTPKRNRLVWLCASIRPGVMCLPLTSSTTISGLLPSSIHSGAGPGATRSTRPWRMNSQPVSNVPRSVAVQIVALVSSSVSASGS